MEDSDDIRGLVERKLRELKLKGAEVSRRIGKERTYLHDYLKKRSPLTMPDEQKLFLAPILKVHPAQLGVSPAALMSRKSPPGMAEDDIEDYRPGPDSLLPPSHIALKRIKNHALDQHPKGLVPGRVVPFNTLQIDQKTIEAGAVVWVNLAKRSDPLVHMGSIIRQFLPPDKLVTNSSERNEIMTLNDPQRDLVGAIMGTMAPYVLDDLQAATLREDTVAITREQLNKSS